MSGPHAEGLPLYPLGMPYPDVAIEAAVRMFAVIVDGDPQPAAHFAAIERWPDARFDLAVWPEVARGRAVINVATSALHDAAIPARADEILADAGWIRSAAWERVGCDGFRAPVVRIRGEHQATPG